MRVLGRSADSRHSVIFGVVACCDGEVLVEQLRVAGHARHLGRRSLAISYVYAVITMREIVKSECCLVVKGMGAGKIVLQ